MEVTTVQLYTLICSSLDACWSVRTATGYKCEQQILSMDYVPHNSLKVTFDSDWSV